MELEPNSIDGNGNELEHKLELEDMKSTNTFSKCITVLLQAASVIRKGTHIFVASDGCAIVLN